MSNNTFTEIWKALKDSKNILIPLHVSPDGDSFGSSLAMYYVLKNLGKNPVLISQDKVDGYFDLFEEYKLIKWETDILTLDFSNFDTILALDSTDPYRYLKDQKREYKFPETVKVINIDHHEVNSLFGDINYVNSKASSTSEILYDLLIENKAVPLEGPSSEAERILTMLMIGILTDTGIFRYNSRPELFDKVSQITRIIDYIKLVTTIEYNKPIEKKKSEALTLKNMIFVKDKKYIYSKISLKEFIAGGVPIEERGGGCDLINDVRGYGFSFTLAEKDRGRITVSFRSNKGIDTSVFARALGGNGHKPASGCLLLNMSLEEAEKKVLAVIEKGFVIGSHPY